MDDNSKCLDDIHLSLTVGARSGQRAFELLGLSVMFLRRAGASPKSFRWFLRDLTVIRRDLTGSLLERTGSLPERTGSLPELTGSLTERTGSLPERTGSLSERTVPLLTVGVPFENRKGDRIASTFPSRYCIFVFNHRSGPISDRIDSHSRAARWWIGDASSTHAPAANAEIERTSHDQPAPQDTGYTATLPHMFCDLHAHSTASDGTIPPEHLPSVAYQMGVSALALTDHDTTAGLAACAAECKALDIAFVPGIEVSAQLSAIKHVAGGGGERLEADVRGTLHLLGLFIRQDDSRLMAIHHGMVEARDGRNAQIIARLQELGVRIDYAEVQDHALARQSDVVGRPHIAQLLVARGYAKSVQDAFRRYLGQGAAAYVRRDRLAPGDAIDAIHHAGGLAVLAHPLQMGCEDDQQLELCIKRLKALGLDGIETRHCDHTPADVLRFEALAKSFDLLTSGGSDYHGLAKPVALGSQRVPMRVYENLRRVALERQGAVG